jgi:hypothetical protein
MDIKPGDGIRIGEGLGQLPRKEANATGGEQEDDAAN